MIICVDNDEYDIDIVKFIKTIKDSDDCIIMNGLNTDKIKKLADDQKILDAINIFVKDYNYNHKTYKKYYGMN